MKQKKQTFKFLIGIVLLLVVGSPFLVSQFCVPSSIKVAAGQNNIVDFNMPFSRAVNVRARDSGVDEMTVSWLGLVPLKTVSVEAVPTKEVIPSGEVIGVRVSTNGIYVIGSSDVETSNGIVKPCKELLKKGDIIYKLNGTAITSKEQFRELIETEGERPIALEFERKGNRETITVQAVYSNYEDVYKLGLWVKDGTQGIGTVTYVDPESRSFGALGHGITDSEMKRLLEVKEGCITTTSVTSITKGQVGEPGQLSGAVDASDRNILGEIKQNTALGIYGKLNAHGTQYFEGQKVPIAFQHEVHEGPATILVNLMGTGKQEYNVYIQKVTKYTSEPSKGMVVKIVDERLLGLTNGIVQGMSGSPILQDGKLIGAITHVFIQDPTKGYGIFIENMINNEMN